MNWLAHLFLSDPDPACRIGNLLPDFVSAKVLAELPPEFQPGIAQHRRMDAYADAHPVFRRSVQRFAPPFRRYGGVLVDIFYDHFLARDWPTFAPQPLAIFTAEIYASFNTLRPLLPADALVPLDLMREHDWLCSYARLSGIEEVLQRLSHRLRRPFDLAASIPILEAQYEHFEGDFREFFPILREHLAIGRR
jgi:acyl carrier protein phosphodiesterase